MMCLYPQVFQRASDISIDGPHSSLLDQFGMHAETGVLKFPEVVSGEGRPFFSYSKKMTPKSGPSLWRTTQALLLDAYYTLPSDWDGLKPLKVNGYKNWKIQGFLAKKTNDLRNSASRNSGAIEGSIHLVRAGGKFIHLESKGNDYFSASTGWRHNGCAVSSSFVEDAFEEETRRDLRLGFTRNGIGYFLSFLNLDNQGLDNIPAGVIRYLLESVPEPTGEAPKVVESRTEASRRMDVRVEGLKVQAMEEKGLLTGLVIESRVRSDKPLNIRLRELCRMVRRGLSIH